MVEKKPLFREQRKTRHPAGSDYQSTVIEGRMKRVGCPPNVAGSLLSLSSLERMNNTTDLAPGTMAGSGADQDQVSGPGSGSGVRIRI